MAQASTIGGSAQKTHYDAVARAFHWLTLALLLVIMPIGLVMGDLPRGRLQNACFITHESLGLTVLGLTVLRLLWRLTHRPPPLPALAPLERRASIGVHGLLYLLLLLVPVTGYLFVAFRGIRLEYFGLAEVPALVAKAKPQADLAIYVHKSLQWAIYALVAVHAGAALYHQWRGDGVLSRMLPGRCDKNATPSST
jgi:cytochrome b561